MARSITDLSWDELDAVAQAAGEAAIDRAHDAGIPTFGYIEGYAVFCGSDRVLRPAADAGRPHGVTAVSIEPQTAAFDGTASPERVLQDPDPAEASSFV